MGICTKGRVIYCNECGYEEPNDYYFGVKDWTFAIDSVKEEYHFCSKECLEYTLKNEENYEGKLTVLKTLNSNDKEFKKLINNYQ